MTIESFVQLLNYDHTIRPGKCPQYGDFGVGKGQTAMKQEMDAAEQALSAISDKSQEAQSLGGTQDVMKNLTDMVSHQSQLESGSYEQLMQLRQQSATANLIGANISEALDKGNKTRHAEAMAGAQQVGQAAANVYLPGDKN